MVANAFFLAHDPAHPQLSTSTPLKSVMTTDVTASGPRLASWPLSFQAHDHLSAPSLPYPNFLSLSILSAPVITIDIGTGHRPTIKIVEITGFVTAPDLGFLVFVF